MTSHRPKVVLDTNVVVAALMSKNPNSPTAELLRRWVEGEFELLYSDDILAEYMEKIAARKITLEKADRFLAHVQTLGTKVNVKPSQIKAVISTDPAGTKA